MRIDIVEANDDAGERHDLGFLVLGEAMVATAGTAAAATNSAMTEGRMLVTVACRCQHAAT
jgi:hypothetical protein